MNLNALSSHSHAGLQAAQQSSPMMRPQGLHAPGGTVHVPHRMSGEAGPYAAEGSPGARHTACCDHAAVRGAMPRQAGGERGSSAGSASQGCAKPSTSAAAGTDGGKATSTAASGTTATGTESGTAMNKLQKTIEQLGKKLDDIAKVGEKLVAMLGKKSDATNGSKSATVDASDAANGTKTTLPAAVERGVRQFAKLSGQLSRIGDRLTSSIGQLAQKSRDVSTASSNGGGMTMAQAGGLLGTSIGKLQTLGRSLTDALSQNKAA